MRAEIGELFVGAYLRIKERCPIVQYNVFDDESQGEIDVLGLDYGKGRLFVCEVATHLDGLHYVKRVGDKHVDDSINKFRSKLAHDREFVARSFPGFSDPIFMLWSPYVPVGRKTGELDEMAKTWPGPGTLQLRINDQFASAVQVLADLAAGETKQRGESFFRTLQLLTHLRGPGNKRLKFRLE